MNCYVDGAAETQTITLRRPITPVASGAAAPSYAENTPVTTPVATYTTDDTNSIAWSVGGTDMDFFSIDDDGELRFINPPDFEALANVDGDNVYDITITATETDGVPSNLASAPLALTVRVTNVDEAGAIGDIGGSAQVGVELTAGTVNRPGFCQRDERPAQLDRRDCDQRHSKLRMAKRAGRHHQPRH